MGRHPHNTTALLREESYPANRGEEGISSFGLLRPSFRGGLLKRASPELKIVGQTPPRIPCTEIYPPLPPRVTPPSPVSSPVALPSHLGAQTLSRLYTNFVEGGKRRRASPKSSPHRCPPLSPALPQQSLAYYLQESPSFPLPTRANGWTRESSERLRALSCPPIG